MTIRQSYGDAGGEPAMPPPAAVQTRHNDGKAPERPLSGRFWVLAPSDDEDEDDRPGGDLPAS
jgi:hypothetical protein